MCGIVGVIGGRDAAPLLLDALRRLEYRGYDSAGIATLVNGHIDRRRAEGKLANLSSVLDRMPLSGSTGIGHTRWATHGAPTENNAHPHGTARVSVVHNGIIENHAELREELEAEGWRPRIQDGWRSIAAQELAFNSGHSKLKFGFHNVTGLAWSGRGRVKRVDVSFDGGRNWRGARLESPDMPKCLRRFNIDWVWDGAPAILQARAIDETGYVQPKINQLRATRGSRSIYHNNAIQSWKVNESGEVTKVQVF